MHHRRPTLHLAWSTPLIVFPHDDVAELQRLAQRLSRADLAAVLFLVRRAVRAAPQTPSAGGAGAPHM